MNTQSNNSITVYAPAKINLTLDVTGKRDNGYHDLKMIMQTIDIYDKLTISLNSIDNYNNIPNNSNELSNSIIFSMNKELPDKIPAEKNLVYKAAMLMKKNYNIPYNFNIYLEKNIPAAAGLAGGSSDCAATLIAINKLCNLNLTEQMLCDVGVTLGADVPFCIRKKTMLSEGIGEILTRLPDIPKLWLVLIKPDVNVSTAYVYNNLDLEHLSYHPDTDKMLKYISQQDITGISSCLSNVLETVTIPEYPILSDIKSFLNSNNALGSLMSGSGPTVYGIFSDKQTALTTYKKALDKYNTYDIFISSTV